MNKKLTQRRRSRLIITGVAAAAALTLAALIFCFSQGTPAGIIAGSTGLAAVAVSTSAGIAGRSAKKTVQASA